MKYFTKKADKLITDYIKANHTFIKVEPGKCRYNHHCHANAVNDAVNKGHKRLAMVVYFDSGPIIHFINECKRPGVFKDNTLGYWATQSNYYFIRWIDFDEFNDIFQIHRHYRKTLEQRLPWYIKLFGNFSC